jgi:HK97 family phage prohead protease
MESEIRSLKGELRAVAGFKLEGLAARYGARSSNLGGFYEQIAPGAFARSLRAGDKVVVTKNHDPNFVLGSTKSGTAKVFDSPEGLRFSVQLDKTNTMHTDTYASVKRGDLDSCSFAFKVPTGGDSWADDSDENGQRCQLRTLRDVDLIDCSVVCYPAYPQGTQVDARSLSAKGLLRVAQRKLSLAESQGTTDSLLESASLSAARSALNVQCRRIAEDTDRDLHARAERARKIIEEDAELTKKDNELRARMENAAGIVFGRRSADDDL